MMMIHDEDEDDDDDDDDDGGHGGHGDFEAKVTWTSHKKDLDENLQEKCRTPIPRCAVESHMDKSQVTSRKKHFFMKHLQEKCRTPRRPPRLNTGP